MKTYKIFHFTHGKKVTYNNQEYTVDHVTIRGMDLYIHLNGMSYPVLSTKVHCELTTFLLDRQ